MSLINADLPRIQATDIALDKLLAMHEFPQCGGLAIFIGTVRNHHEGKSVNSLKYTAYKPLAEKMIREIEQEIEEKYSTPYMRVVHRIGHLEIGETAIYAVARAEHRREAFTDIQLGQKEFNVIGEIRAGIEQDFELQAGQVLRIFTGGRLPNSTDTVARQEIVTRNQNRIILDEPLAVGTDIRYQGGKNRNKLLYWHSVDNF